MVLPQPTLCPPKTCHPAFLHRQLPLRYPGVLLPGFVAALGFLAQAVQETWSMFLTLKRWGDGLLGRIVSPYSPGGRSLGPWPVGDRMKPCPPVWERRGTGHNSRRLWLILLHGYWSVSAPSPFAEYQLWEGAGKISREHFHFLSPPSRTWYATRSCHRPYTGLPPGRKTSGATPSFRIHMLPD